jgi:hypothetical protein
MIYLTKIIFFCLIVNKEPKSCLNGDLGLRKLLIILCFSIALETKELFLSNLLS